MNCEHVYFRSGLFPNFGALRGIIQHRVLCVKPSGTKVAVSKVVKRKGKSNLISVAGCNYVRSARE